MRNAERKKRILPYLLVVVMLLAAAALVCFRPWAKAEESDDIFEVEGVFLTPPGAFRNQADQCEHSYYMVYPAAAWKSPIYSKDEYHLKLCSNAQCDQGPVIEKHSFGSYFIEPSRNQIYGYYHPASRFCAVCNQRYHSMLIRCMHNQYDCMDPDCMEQCGQRYLAHIGEEETN